MAPYNLFKNCLHVFPVRFPLKKDKINPDDLFTAVYAMSTA